MPDVTGFLDKYSGGKQPAGSRLRRFSLGFGNALSKWDRRFFVLREGSEVIAYHKSEEDSKATTKPALGTATCAGSVVSIDAMDDSVFSIAQVNDASQRVLFLRAPDSDTARMWVDAIVAAGGTESDPVSQDSMQGLLLLSGKKGKLDKRYFKLADGSLMYFKTESDMNGGKKPAVGSMPISSAVRVDLLAAAKPGEPRCAFAVSNGDASTYTLKAATEEEARRWLQAIVGAGATDPSIKEAKEAKKTTQKRAAVSAEAGSSVDTSNFVKKSYPKSPEARQFIFGVVAKSALFAGASPEQREELVDAMQERKCTDGELIIQQGDDGDHFYVVRSGEYAVFLKQKGDTPVFKYQPGGSFGELALLYNKPRAATIKCVGAGLVYQLHRQTFQGVLRAGNKTKTDANKELLKRVPMLENLTGSQLDSLISILREIKIEDGESVAFKDDPITSLYIVKEGLVNMISDYTSKSGVTPYAAGDCIGLPALSSTEEANWSGTITSVGNVTLLRLDRDKVIETLGDISTLLRDNFQQKVLGSIEMFKALSPSDISLLIDAFTEARYVKGDHIIKQGDEGDTFYIVRAGKVRVSITNAASAGGGEREIAKLTVGDYFGEMALLNKSARMATVTAMEATTCMVLSRDVFTKVLGPLKELLDREADRRKAELESASKRQAIKLDDLKELGTLGVGTFGRVKLVHHLPTEKCYALKCMRKRQLIALKQVEHVMNEKNLLGLCNHPFLINLAGAYQDNVELYMLLELALGGELFSLLRDKVRFDEGMSRFYGACVLSAFVHLHDHNIVYRDLKPENLLLDAKGYIKICDFGFAKVVEDRTFTLCGTPEYLAPEIISNSGHTLAVDWWALGILMFEMLTGDPPFVADDPMELYQDILRGSFVYPSVVGKSAKDLIGKLLISNPALRLGIAKRGHRDLVGHVFFKLIDMTLLVKRTGKPTPPYVPQIKGDNDMSNFDELEEGAGMAQDPSWSQPCNSSENALFEGFAD